MRSFLKEIRLAARSLRRSPGFTALAALTLAVGIGATTALFSAVDTLVLRPLPLERPERLVTLEPDGEGFVVASFSYPQLQELRERARSLRGIAASTAYEFDLRGEGPSTILAGEFVSPDYFEVLGVRPSLGRFFSPDADGAGAAIGVVLSDALWRERFGGRADAVGAPVVLNGHPATVVGVAPRGFTTRRVGAEAPALWVPLPAYATFESPAALGEGRYSLSLVGRLRDGVTLRAAAAEFDPFRWAAPQSPGLQAGFRRLAVRPLDPVAAPLRGRVSGYLWLVGAAAALMLLIAAVNVAGMLLARAVSRRTEMGVRAALGASRGRLVRLLVGEGLALFLLGGAGGAVLAAWMCRLVAAFPWPVPVQLDLSVDRRALGFALGVALLTGLLGGLAPALQATRGDLGAGLRAGGARLGPPRSRLRGALVVLQLALSLLLLVCSGLFVRALQRAWEIDPGFEPAGVSTAELPLRTAGYDAAGADAFVRRLLERARALPGVESAAVASSVPFGAHTGMMSVEPQGAPAAEGDPMIFARFAAVSPEYLRTLRIPLLRGRAPTGGAGEDPPGAVVSRAFARRYWPGEDPLGKRLEREADGLRVVGVAADVRPGALTGVPEPMLYVPRPEAADAGAPAPREVVLVVRMRGRPAPVLAALRAEVRALDPGFPALAFTPLADRVGATLLPQRVGARLVGAFGVFGALLAALGLYGVLSFAVACRTREIGLRLALGAARRDVVRLVVRDGVRLAAAGVGFGLLAALAASRLVRGLLYGVSPHDPLTYGAVALLLLGVALLAAWVPTRRAASVEPMVALRTE